jgi:FlaG/FlaF family flagellin (archaellin)
MQMETISGGGFMKSLIHAVAFALVLAAPVASFAQAASQDVSQDTQSSQTQTANQQHTARSDNSGYGSYSQGTWQSGRGSDTTVSSYSPPIHNAR